MQKVGDPLSVGDSTSNNKDKDKDTSQVNFVCQQCFRPLKLDPSLFSMHHDTERDLSSTNISSELSL